MGEIADDIIDQGFYEYYEAFDGDDGEIYYRSPRRQLPPMWLSGQHTGVATEKAVLWQLLDGRQEWFPRTQIVEIQRHQMLISGWIAQQKNLSQRDNQSPFHDEPPPVQSADEYGYSGYEPCR